MAGHVSTANDPALSGITQGEPRPGLIELGPGYLDPALLPAGLVAGWASAAVDRWGARTMAYGANAGPRPLRAELAARMARAGICRCAPENVMTTPGTSAALDQLAARFAGEGRIVLTEALTYDFGRMIFTGHGVRTVAVPGPGDDLDIDELRGAADRAARLTGLPPVIYLIPTFHNPTGRVLSAERRAEVLALAGHTGAVVIEDQAYAELSYQSAGLLPSLWDASDDPNRVIGLYSMAKCLGPGLRVGWLVGAERLVADLAAQPARLSGGGPNHFAAMAVMAGCAGDGLDSHITGLREHLRLRRDALVTALTGQLPAGFTLSVPMGGFFVWIGLPDHVHDEILLADAERRGVSFAAGHRFGANPAGVRLCFSACSPERLTLGAERFAQACRAVSGGR